MKSLDTYVNLVFQKCAITMSLITEAKGTNLKKASKEKNNKGLTKFKDPRLRSSLNTMCTRLMKKTSIAMKVMVKGKN